MSLMILETPQNWDEKVKNVLKQQKMIKKKTLADFAQGGNIIQNTQLLLSNIKYNAPSEISVLKTR